MITKVVTSCAACPFAERVWKSDGLLYLYCQHPSSTMDPRGDGIRPIMRSGWIWEARPHQNHASAPTEAEAFGYIPYACPLVLAPVRFVADAAIALSCPLCHCLIHDPAVCEVETDNAPCGCTSQ